MNKNSFLSQNNRNSKKDTLIVRLLSVVCLIGGFQVATQYFAHQFNYQPQLGAQLFHIYEPWAILLWANKWYGEYSEHVRSGGRFRHFIFQRRFDTGAGH
ncbi:MAG: hypothetical protein V9E86_09835 [Nitrosomonas sp.]